MRRYMNCGCRNKPRVVELASSSARHLGALEVMRPSDFSVPSVCARNTGIFQSGGTVPSQALRTVTSSSPCAQAHIAEATSRRRSAAVAPTCGKFIMACSTPRKCQASASASVVELSSPFATAAWRMLLRIARCPVSPCSATACPPGGRSAISAQARTSIHPLGFAASTLLGMNSNSSASS